MINQFEASFAILSEIAKKRGFFDHRFLTNWSEIVGEDVSQKCSPSKMTFDFLKKEATVFVFSEDMQFKSTFTHHKQIILEKIRFFFGVNFIKDVKIIKINDL